MRILLVTQIYAPEAYSAAIRLRNLADGLRAKGDHVDVLTTMPNYPTGRIFDGYRGKFSMVEKEGGDNVYRYWLWADNSYNKAKKLFSVISFAISLRFFGLKRKICKSYDVVIVQSPQLPVAFSAISLFKRWYKKPIILNVSDIHPNSIEDGGSFDKDGMMYKIQRALEKYLYRNADMLLGQSQEIIDHVHEYRDIDSFLYRNLQSMEGNNVVKKEKKGNKLVYAGLLSKTQGVLSIIQNVDFKSKGLEFHIYGDGNERVEIEKLCDGKSIFYHGSIPNSRMFAELQQYNASIVPLAKALKGAVPSKIYNVVAAGMPFFFIGKKDGEAAKIVKTYDIGWVAALGDYASLNAHLESYRKMSDEDYLAMVDRCLKLSENDFNLEMQIKKLSEKIKRFA